MKTKLPASPKVLIIPQPRFGVPAVNGGASAFVIENTLDCLPESANAWALSYWDKSLENEVYDRRRYHHIRRNGIKFRLIRKIAKSLNQYVILDDLPSLYSDYLLALRLEILKTKPDILVVHTTKMHWALSIAQTFPEQKLVIYHHNGEAHLLNKNMLLKLTQISYAHIFVSNQARDMFEQTINSLPSPPNKSLRTTTIQNGINIERILKAQQYRLEIRKNLNITNDMFVLIFAGRLIKRKGLHKILDALDLLAPSILSQVELLVAGAEDYHGNSNTAYIEQMKNRITTNNLNKRVHFLGYITHDNINKYYLASDLLIFPSIEPEGLPLTILEAQSYGLPVIASAVGGVGETLVHGKTGYLIEPPGNPHQIAHYIEEIIQHKDWYKKMKLEAIHYVQQSFSKKRMANKFWEFMQYTDQDV